MQQLIVAVIVAPRTYFNGFFVSDRKSPSVSPSAASAAAVVQKSSEGKNETLRPSSRVRVAVVVT